jgi:hypothetical protein
MNKIRNWKKFQHFKDRRPPWIKLYRELLDDPNWHDLNPEASKALIMLWLLASELDGYLPDIRTISFRLRISYKETKTILSQLSQWLECDDINVISKRYQDDTPETETETETETDDFTIVKSKREKFILPNWIPEDKWRSYCEMRTRIRKPMTDNAKNLIISDLNKLSSKGYDPGDVLDQSVKNSWQGVFEIKQQNGAQNGKSKFETGIDAAREGLAIALKQSGKAENC